MSISFYVEDWDKQPTEEQKVLASIIFETNDKDLLDHFCENDPYFQKDENDDWFEMRTIEKDPFPTTNIVNGNITLFLNLIGFNYSSHGKIPLEELDVVIKIVQRSLNTKRIVESNKRDDYVSGNFTFCGIDSDDITDKLKEILELLVFAKKNNKFVYWG